MIWYRFVWSHFVIEKTIHVQNFTILWLSKKGPKANQNSFLTKLVHIKRYVRNWVFSINLDLTWLLKLLENLPCAFDCLIQLLFKQENHNRKALTIMLWMHYIGIKVPIQFAVKHKATRAILCDITENKTYLKIDLWTS